MLHSVFSGKIQKALGDRPAPAARDVLRALRNGATEVYIRYEWVKDNRFFQWVLDEPDVDFGDGEERIVVWLQNDSNRS